MRLRLFGSEIPFDAGDGTYRCVMVSRNKLCGLSRGFVPAQRTTCGECFLVVMQVEGTVLYRSISLWDLHEHSYFRRRANLAHADRRSWSRHRHPILYERIVHTGADRTQEEERGKTVEQVAPKIPAPFSPTLSTMPITSCREPCTRSISTPRVQ